MTGRAVLTLASIILLPLFYIALLAVGFRDMDWVLRLFFGTGATVLTYATIDYFRGISEDRRQADARRRSTAEDEG